MEPKDDIIGHKLVGTLSVTIQEAPDVDTLCKLLRSLPLPPIHRLLEVHVDEEGHYNKPITDPKRWKVRINWEEWGDTLRKDYSSGDTLSTEIHLDV